MSLGVRIEGNIEGERQQIERAEPTVAKRVNTFVMGCA